MSEEIEPALTPEEWALWEARVSWARYQDPRPDFVEMASIPENARPHGVAAKLLHDQPFGFTWEDVDRLIGLELIEMGTTSITDEEDGPPLRDLADRIASLLPPRA